MYRLLLSAELSLRCAKSGGDPCPKRVGGSVTTLFVRHSTCHAIDVRSFLMRHALDRRSTLTLLSRTTNFERTAHFGLNPPRERSQCSLIVSARSAQWAGVFAFDAIAFMLARSVMAATRCVLMTRMAHP